MCAAQYVSVYRASTLIDEFNMAREPYFAQWLHKVALSCTKLRKVTPLRRVALTYAQAAQSCVKLHEAVQSRTDLSCAELRLHYTELH